MSPHIPRRSRMHRSRRVAAGASVGALVATTAAIAVLNPAPSASARTDSSTDARTGAARQPSTQVAPRTDDRWSDQGTDPWSDDGWSAPAPPPDQFPSSGGSTFDPGFGFGGSSRSGGS